MNRSGGMTRFAVVMLAVITSAGAAWAGEAPAAIPAAAPTQAMEPEAVPLDPDACEPEVQGETQDVEAAEIPLLDRGVDVDSVAVCSARPQCFRDRDCNPICG